MGRGPVVLVLGLTCSSHRHTFLTSSALHVANVDDGDGGTRLARAPRCLVELALRNQQCVALLRLESITRANPPVPARGSRVRLVDPESAKESARTRPFARNMRCGTQATCGYA